MIEFFVPGVPQPGGSKRGFYIPKTGRVVVVEDAKNNAPWRALVVLMARGVIEADPLSPCPLRGSVLMNIVFVMPRPKSHYRTGKNSALLREDAPKYHTNKPDLTKLVRSTEDALSDAGVWGDDTQVAQMIVEKRYTDAIYGTPGAWIKLREIKE